jgi:SAM-dependent methyltransferase
MRRPYSIGALGRVGLAATVLNAAILLTIGAAGVSADPRDKERWNQKYSEETYRFGKDPIPFLVEQVARLPKGRVLDVAMGEGRNGVFLAAQGFRVIGIDISERGLEKAKALAAERGATIETKVVDLEEAQFEQGGYDVVLCTYYFDRSLMPRLKEALRSGGMIVMETYTMDHLRYRPDFRKDYLLKTNELLDLLRDFTILHYQVRDTGDAAFASILAQKP